VGADDRGRNEKSIGREFFDLVTRDLGSKYYFDVCPYTGEWTHADN